MKLLKGITWNHSRGYVPMTATAQRFSELHPGVEIQWEKRSLQNFADSNIETLAKNYDLMVIDHPWTGFGAHEKVILPVSDYLSPEFYRELEENSVGKSFESYCFDGKLWAYPLDAATPVASARLDLLEKHGKSVPKTYQEVVELAKMGLVAFAGIPIDVLMSFYMYCVSLGEAPFQSETSVISDEIGVKALQEFKALSDLIDPANFKRNPIQVYEAMTQSDSIAYCPFAYGYSNYSRAGYSEHLLHFYDLVSMNNKPMVSSLGGAGLAISALTKHPEEAVEYLKFTGSAFTQAGLYTDNGGQPGHLQAWKSERLNQLSHDYFINTLPALERAYLRPRYLNHMHFQDNAGDLVQEYLMHGGDEREVLRAMDDLYIESLKH